MRKILLLLLLLASPVQADKPDLEQLTREAFDIYPNKINFSMPEVEVMPAKEMQDWVCRNRCVKDMVVKGVFHEGVIYISDSITAWDDWDQSLYIHEVIHYIQSLDGKTSKGTRETCANHLLLELEAYNLQNEWLKKHGKFIKDRDVFDLAVASVGKGCKKTVDSQDK